MTVLFHYVITFLKIVIYISQIPDFQKFFHFNFFIMYKANYKTLPNSTTQMCTLICVCVHMCNISLFLNQVMIEEHTYLKYK